MEYEKCYVFHAEERRPAKKRRIEGRGLHASWELRRKAYESAWKQQNASIQSALEDIHAASVTEIQTFLDEVVHNDSSPRVPCGILLAEPGSASQASLIQHLSAPTARKGRRLLASLDSSAATNLNSALKTIIKRATARSGAADEGENDDDDVQISRKGRRYLNYDLQILLEHVRERKVEQVIVMFQDTEAFNSEVLSDLVELLACWCDRIPFVFLASVATSVDFFQKKLSKAAIKSMKGKLFNTTAHEQELEVVLSAVTNTDAVVWLGPSVLRSALERQSDYMQGIDAFVNTLKYAYMSSYYANPLSLFLDSTLQHEHVPKDHFEALRNTASFQSGTKQLLEDGLVQQVRDILESDEALFIFTQDNIRKGREYMASLVLVLDVIRIVQEKLPEVPVSSKSALYIQATTGKLKDSALLRSLLLSMRKAPAEVNLEILRAASELPLDEEFSKQIVAHAGKVETLIQSSKASGQTLRSEDTVGKSTMRTTVVAQKVGLSKQKSELSEQDAAYTKIIRQISDDFEDYFSEYLVDPKSLIFHEIFLYDLRSPHREVFTPRPRHAIERALASPHDYLDCDCCAPENAGDEATLSATQPATAVLYQLYLESGSLINVHDLWQAFQAVMGEGAEEAQTMALFQRGLADLRYLGMVKGTRKRADHIAKVAWRGL